MRSERRSPSWRRPRAALPPPGQPPSPATACWAVPASPSIRTGPSRSPTTGPSATWWAWPSTRATTSGSSTGPGSLNQQERGADADPPLAECCRPAPPVIEFNQEGDVVQAWGGPGHGYEWPQSEHGIFIDHLDNVWLAGSGGNDSQILKFTRHGRFLLQIGAQGAGPGEQRPRQLRATGRDRRRPGDQRGLHRRRLRQPARRGLRRRHRRVPPALGRLRQRPHRRRLHLRSGRAAVAAVRASRCTARRCPPTGWSTSATA